MTISELQSHRFYRTYTMDVGRVMAISCGDCFRWAAKRALKAFSSEEPLVMVHATVQPAFGLTAAGEVYPNRNRFAHAWIERRGKVMDWQTANGLAVNADGTQRGRMHLWTLDDFCDAMQPRDIQRYTPEQAALMPMRTRNYGPWSDAERRAHADLMARRDELIAMTDLGMTQ